MCNLVAQTVWLAFIVTVTAISFDQFADCNGGAAQLVYLFLSMALFFASMVCHFRIYKLSLNGSVIDDEERAGMNHYLTIRNYIHVVEILVAVYGIILLGLRSSIQCNSEMYQADLNYAFILVVIISQLIDSVGLMCCCYLLYSNKADSVNNNSEGMAKNLYNFTSREDVDETTLQLWASRCQSITNCVRKYSCNLFAGEDLDSFEEVCTAHSNS